MEVLALFGPTAIGKTAVAIALAERLRERGEQPVAVSADAIQVYRGLETISGAASEAEQAALETRLISMIEIDRTFSAGQYAAMAHREIDALIAAGCRPIVVGGTGLYLRAALCELELGAPPPDGLRERLEAEYDARGGQAMIERLTEFDPSVADIEPADKKRVVRAAELAEQGQRISRGSLSQLWTEDTRRPTRLIGLTAEREWIYEQIDRRVERMVAAGAADEVARAVAAGASETARKALGFEELLAGDIDTMKLRTRQYAKRQLTWMRKLAGVELIDVTGLSAEQVAAHIDHGSTTR